MPERNQSALDFLTTRRSRPAKTLTTPVPDRDEVLSLLTVAARCPDHGKLEPWRFIVLEKAALTRLAGTVAYRGDGWHRGHLKNACGDNSECGMLRDCFMVSLLATTLWL